LKKVGGLRLAVVAFRDHEDEDYVVEDFQGFTDNICNVKSNLKSLKAEGGRDGPEAVAAALDKALQLKWREDTNCAKVAVLIVDAPPHGIGEENDDYSLQIINEGIKGKLPQSSLFNDSCESF
jgi:hypothetical protein